MIEVKPNLPLIPLDSPDQSQLIDELQLEALFEVYPQARGFQDLFPKTVVSASTKTMQTQERKDKPEASMPIYQTILRNLPKDPRNPKMPDSRVKHELDQYYYFVSEARPVYTNFETGEVYVRQQIMADLMSKDLERRLDGSCRLGFRTIEENIRALAYKLNPTPIGMSEEFLWLPMFRAHVDEFYEEMERVLSGKDRIRFRRSRPEVLYFFSKKGLDEQRAHLVAVGAQVLYHQFDQPLMMAEDAIGTPFDKGTVQILASPVKRLFLERLGKEMGINLTNNEISPETQVHAQRIYKILELEGEALFDAYIHSKPPQLYMASDVPELNPFEYPQIVDPSLWLKWE